MADAHPSEKATSEPHGLGLGGTGSESFPQPIDAELCIHCRALVFNERDHFDTLKDYGYRLVWDDNGDLQLEIDKDRFFCPAGLFKSRLGITSVPLRAQLRRKDSIPNLPSITATAESGCHFCKCLLSCRTTNDITKLHDTQSKDINLTIEFYYRCDQSPFGVRYLVAATTVDTVPETTLAEPFIVEAGIHEAYAQVLGIRTKTFLPNWNFDKKAAIMRKWIGNCENQCHPERLDRTLPTRLLDLSSSQDPYQDVQLVYSNDIPNPIGCKYAALSHCWGPPDLPPLKTKMDSLDKMLCNIPFGSLPANYRDAVRVTRGLGIDYLWIDSLCIVQDHLEDWEAESLRMVDVYQQAHVTLIVATGNCCHDGFLDPKADQRIEMPYVSSLAGSPINHTYYLRKGYNTNQDIQKCPWNQRGWTLQENAFSTRRLYFTQNAISFSCDGYLRSTDGTRVWAGWISTVKSSLNHANINRCYRSWSKLTEQYTQRNLTCHQDRLPAISALAQLMSQRMSDRYFAGLWEGNFLHGLLWTCDANFSTQTLIQRTKLSLTENFVAPSWSWASQTRGIRYGWVPENYKKLYEICEIEVSPIGSSPYGRLKSGRMVISGTVRPLIIAPIYKVADFFRSALDGICQIDYFMDWWEERMDVSSEQEIDRGIVQNVKMLLLASCDQHPVFRTFFTRTCGLLLLHTGVSQEYWRVGTFRIRHGRDSDWGKGYERSTITIV